jgi:phage shock protein A
MGIFKTIVNVIKGKSAVADETLKKSQAVVLGKQAIVASEQKIAEHKQRIGDFSAKIKVQRTKLKEASVDVNKWTNIAVTEASKGNQDTARTALVEKNKFSSQVNTLESEIDKNEKVLSKEKTSLAALEAKVEQAKNDFDNLSIRKEGAEMRKSQTGINPNENCFSALDDLKEQVVEAECQAEAYEEEAGCGTEAAKLAAQYESNNTNVEDELAALLAKNKKD